MRNEVRVFFVSGPRGFAAASLGLPLGLCPCNPSARKICGPKRQVF